MADEELKKMGEYLKALGIPKAESKEELKKILTDFGTDPASKVKSPLNTPRLPIFFGEEGKGDVSYPTWLYEVKSLLVEKLYPEEVLIQIVRRSLRGHAADQLRYLGVRPSIPDILQNFNSTYGSVETPESILRKFYACKQAPDETVLNYCIRLEDIHAKAVELEAIGEADGMLKRVFFRGLTPRLKHLSSYKFETTKDFLSFKKEVRLIENDMEEEAGKDVEEVKGRCHAVNKKEDKKEKTRMEQQLNDIATVLEKLGTRMDSLEKNQQPTYCQQATSQQAPSVQQSEETLPTCQQTSQHSHFSQHSHSSNQGQANAYYGQPSGAPQYDCNFPFQQNNAYRPVGLRGQKHFRGPRASRPRGQGPFRGQGRGQEAYRPRRPLATNNFISSCYGCGETGHFIRDCPHQPECYCCHERGHYARDCPLNR